MSTRHWCPRGCGKTVNGYSRTLKGTNKVSGVYLCSFCGREYNKEEMINNNCLINAGRLFN